MLTGHSEPLVCGGETVYSLLNTQHFSPGGVSQSKFDEVFCGIMLIYYITADERRHEGRKELNLENLNLLIKYLEIIYRYVN